MNNKFFMIIALIAFMGLIFVSEGCDKEKDLVETTGSISGTVTDKEKGKIIVGAEVKVSGVKETKTTKSDGKYEFTDLEEGDYTITVSKNNYVTYTKTVNVKAAQERTVDILLERDVPKLKVEPEKIDFSHEITQTTFTITNENSNKDLIWKVEISEDVDWLYVSKYTGTLKKGEEVITIWVNRNKMPTAKEYSTNVVVKSTNGGGQAEIAVTAKKVISELSVTPKVLDFGNTETAMEFTIENKTPETTLDWTSEIPEEINWISLSEVSGSLETAEQITATVDRTKLTEAKAYTTTINIKDINSSKVETIVVTVVKDVPKLKVTPNNIDFGSDKEQMTFSITNGNTSAPLDWQIEKPETVNWLSLSATSGKELGVGETVITLTIDRTKMSEAKLYTTSVVVKSTNGGGSENINVTASKKMAKLSVTPKVLNFGKAETAMTFNIENKTAGTTLAWTAEIPEEIQWLSLSETSGSVESSKEITATVDKSLLTEAKVYNTTIKIKDNNSTDIETIVVTVIKDVPKLKVTPNNIDFGDDKEQMTFSITNGNTSAPLDWQIEKPETANWLSLSATSGKELGVGETVITLTIDRTKMSEAKLYTTSVVVKSTNGGGSENINVTASKKMAKLSVTPKVLNFGKAETAMTFNIENKTAGTTLAWTAEIPEEIQWLSLSATSGSIESAEEITATVDKSLLTESKTYTTTITIKDNNSTDVESIVVTVVKDVPKLRVTPENVDFGTDKEKMTFTIINSNPSSPMDWQIEKPESATWLSLSETDGTALSTGDKVITLTVDRESMPEEKQYNTSLIVKSTNGGGSVTVNVSAEKEGAYLQADPKALSFGTNQSEETVLISNSTQKGTLTFSTKSNESWITVENGSGTITDSETASIKISVSRLNLAAGSYNGTVVISSNKNTVTVNVAMEVLAKQAPIVTSLQSTEVKHNSINVSAYISSVGSAAVSAYGFCWGTSPNPTTADNKNNLGGTSTEKSFNSTISGLTASTLYYVRAYAINEEGTSYSDALSVTTLAPPTMAVVRTFAAEDVKYNKAKCNGSIDDLGDGYVTAYGFCYSTTNPNPSLSDKSMSLGSTTEKGNFSGDITGLKEQTKYFVRAYATNSKGTAYGASIEFTTPIAPPLVTAGLLAYYTFDNENCNDYFGEENYSGILQGTGEAPTFTTDIPGVSGKSMKCTKGKYYFLPMAPDQSVNEYSYAVWIKTKSTGYIYSSNSNRFSLYKNKVVYYHHSYSDDSFDLDLATILFDGKWHHVVITRKNNGRKLYIDGRFLVTGGYSNDPGSTATIGNDYMGHMDNLRIYNRALTQEEIKEIYKAKQ